MEHRTSLFERLFNDPDRPWLALACAVGFSLIPFAGAALADDPGMFLQVGSWRAGLLFAPTMIIYTVAAASSMEPGWQRVYTSLRSVVMISDEAYSDLIDSATAVPLRGELLAVAVGAAFALSRLANTLMNVPTWRELYLLLSTAILYGLLAWLIYFTVARTQATATVLRQPLLVDAAEISAFLVIGEQGLILALLFIGGMTLSLLLLLYSALDPSAFLQIDFWLIYIPLALTPVAIFFLAMLPTHRVLANAKANQLLEVRRELRRASLRLLEHLAHDQDTAAVTQQILALTVLEQRLQVARTWPYNTTMLRTLFVSVMAPAALLIIRKVLERL